MAHKIPYWLKKYQIKKGQHFSPETQFKKTVEKVKKNCIICGKIFENYISQKQKCCSKDCGYKAISGKDAPNWKGGITNKNQAVRRTKQYLKWRMVVLVKADFKCNRCGVNDSWHAHHKKPFAKYPEVRYDIENGECLCNKCHDETKKGSKRA